MLTHLFLKLFGATIAADQLRTIAEGKRGPEAKAVFDWLVREKAVNSLVLACLVVFCIANGYLAVAAAAATVGGLLISAGIVDAQWQAPPPSWETRWWWVILHKVAPDVTLVVGALTLKYHTCDVSTAAALSRFHLSCSLMTIALTGFGMVFLWAFGRARLATPPNGGVKLQVLQPDDAA